MEIRGPRKYATAEPPLSLSQRPRKQAHTPSPSRQARQAPTYLPPLLALEGEASVASLLPRHDTPGLYLHTSYESTYLGTPKGAGTRRAKYRRATLFAAQLARRSSMVVGSQGTGRPGVQGTNLLAASEPEHHEKTQRRSPGRPDHRLRVLPGMGSGSPCPTRLTTRATQQSSRACWASYCVVVSCRARRPGRCRDGTGQGQDGGWGARGESSEGASFRSWARGPPNTTRLSLSRRLSSVSSPRFAHRSSGERHSDWPPPKDHRGALKAMAKPPRPLAPGAPNARQADPNTDPTREDGNFSFVETSERRGSFRAGEEDCSTPTAWQSDGNSAV